MMFLVFAILVIYLAVEIFRYFKVKANAFSQKEVRKAANNHAEKLTYIDPVITCDYCGSKIDTSKHNVCPQCGGPYDKDKEWLLRHVPEEEFIEDGTREVIAAREKKAAEESEKILKRIRIMIAILGTLTSIFVISFFIFGIIAIKTKYRRSEEVNEKSYETYIPADYQVSGDGVLYDSDDVKISLTGFYIEENKFDDETYEYVGSVKMSLHIENNRNEGINVLLTSNAYNGLASENYPMYSYAAYRPGSYDVYETISKVPMQQIHELIFDKVEVNGRKSEFSGKNEKPVVIETTSDYKQEIICEDGNLLFSNDYADVFCKYEQDEYNEGYRLYIVNKSGKGYVINGRNTRVDGNDDILYGFYDEYLPVGYVFRTQVYHALKDVETYADLRDHKVEINIVFKCAEDPTYSFETPYMELDE